MTHKLWSRIAAPMLTVLALVILSGFVMAYAWLPGALLLFWLVGSIACFSISLWRHSAAWATSALIQTGGVLVAVSIWQGITNWWWPLGLVALGVIYLSLASMLPDQMLTSWRAPLEMGGLFVAGVGAFWELGQVFAAYLLTWQGTPLLVEEDQALRRSFMLSSVLLVGASLLWGMLRRRLTVLALTALLLAQLAVALVINASEIGNPNAEALFALALLVVALACHVGTYPLRFWLPDLAAENAPRLWRLLLQRRGRMRAAQAVKALPHPDAWWLCFLLDCLALLLTMLAIIPVTDQSTAGSPNSGPLLIVLTAGWLLSVAVAYWQQAPWLGVLAGLFLAADIYALGGFAATPATTWPLLYFAATTGLLGLAIWLRSSNGLVWARPCLLVALGAGCLALVFALEHQSLAWQLGMALALLVVAGLAFWGWRLAQSTG